MARTGRNKPGLMTKTMEKKRPLQKRGMGEVERSKSGGAVRGPIPKPGGTNAMDFESGIGYSSEMKRMAKKTMVKKALPKKAGRKGGK